MGQLSAAASLVSVRVTLALTQRHQRRLQPKAGFIRPLFAKPSMMRPDDW